MVKAIHHCPVPLPRYSREQGRALDFIGVALAEGRITWNEALSLRELVRARFVRSALATLKNHSDKRKAA